MGSEAPYPAIEPRIKGCIVPWIFVLFEYLISMTNVQILFFKLSTKTSAVLLITICHAWTVATAVGIAGWLAHGWVAVSWEISLVTKVGHNQFSWDQLQLTNSCSSCLELITAKYAYKLLVRLVDHIRRRRKKCLIKWFFHTKGNPVWTITISAVWKRSKLR